MPERMPNKARIGAYSGRSGCMTCGKNGEAQAGKTVQVFILAGQSNMEGHGIVDWGRNPEYDKSKKGYKREIKGGIGCLRTLATDPRTAPTYKKFY